MTKERPRLKRRDDRETPGRGEKALMAFSVLVSVALFGYVLYEAIVTPQDVPPTAELVSQRTTEEGDVLVVVALVVPGGVGLRDAEVEVKCAEPPPAVTFTNVPSKGRREGEVMCPPGTQDPEVSVSWYVRA